MFKRLAVLALIGAIVFHFTFVITFYKKTEFKKIVTEDNSNDDAIYMNAQELLTRSGYKYEEYYSIASDGYITQLVRIVSPLADRTKLKKAPILLYHGGNVDMTSYLIASSIQHHPEKFPRVFEEDGPITSSNRSLAFTLANNGYDVWLIGTRGSNNANMAYVTDFNHFVGVISDSKGEKLVDKDGQLFKYSETEDYWSYGMDDIVNHEIKYQFDKVLKVTGAKEFSLLGFSLSVPSTLAFLALNPNYAIKVKVYFQVGPAINVHHFSTFDKIYFEKFCPLFPTRGIGFTPTYTIKSFIKKLVIESSRSVTIRYTIIHCFISTIFGPSPIYQTNLERNILAHVFQPISFKSVQHYCQNAVVKKLQKFDYGPKLNKLTYGTEKPHIYKVDKIDVQNYAIISGSLDALAGPETVERLKKQVKAKTPVKHIVADNYNHLDLIAGVEVDKYVNLPILEFLNQHNPE